MIAAGRLDAPDIVAHVDRQLAAIGRRRSLGAFVDVDVEGARAAASAGDARLARGEPARALEGVTFGIKSNIAVAGLPWTAGIEGYRHRVADEDAPVVASLRAAGAVVLGTTAMAEGAFGATTDNVAFGRCFNPHAAGHVAGGSSGGSAAAVAAGLCDAALGTDTMGSVRLPSSYCGVIGFKPARGVLADGGVVPLSRLLDVVGVHATSVAAAAAIVAAVATDRPCEQASEAGVVGVLSPATFDAPEPIRAAVAAARDRLTRAGVATHEVGLAGLDLGRLRRRTLLVVEAEGAAIHGGLLGNRTGLTDAFREALEWGARQSAVAFAGALHEMADAAATLREAWRGYSAVVMPTTLQQAFSFDAPVPADQADLTVLANLLDWPALNVPGAPAGGLPVGVQVLAPRPADALAVARVIEAPLR